MDGRMIIRLYNNNSIKTYGRHFGLELRLVLLASNVLMNLNKREDRKSHSMAEQVHLIRAYQGATGYTRICATLSTIGNLLSIVMNPIKFAIRIGTFKKLGYCLLSHQVNQTTGKVFIGLFQLRGKRRQKVIVTR